MANDGFDTNLSIINASFFSGTFYKFDKGWVWSILIILNSLPNFSINSTFKLNLLFKTTNYSTICVFPYLSNHSTYLRNTLMVENNPFDCR